MIATITLRSPLAHAGFGSASIGNAIALRREPIVSLPGHPLVPTLSGNALRGVIRRTIMRELFDRAGVGRETCPKGWDKLYAALANGGHLTSSEKQCDPAALAELRAKIPPLSLIGAALYSYMLPGHIRVGFAWLVCRETVEAGLIQHRDDVSAAEDLVCETGLVRHVDRTIQSPEVSGVTPMPVTVECVAAGAQLESSIRCGSHTTEIERSCLARALRSIDTLGAKGSSGFGQCVIECDGDDGPYQAWLDEHAQSSVRDELIRLAASF